jgi:hypothetical protein
MKRVAQDCQSGLSGPDVLRMALLMGSAILPKNRAFVLAQTGFQCLLTG